MKWVYYHLVHLLVITCNLQASVFGVEAPAGLPSDYVSPSSLNLAAIDESKASVHTSKHEDIMVQEVLALAGYGFSRVLLDGKVIWTTGRRPFALVINVVYKLDQLKLLKVQKGSGDSAELIFHQCTAGTCKAIGESEYNEEYLRITGRAPENGETIDVSKLPTEGLEIKKHSPKAIHATAEFTPRVEVTRVVDGPQVLWHAIGKQTCTKISLFMENERMLLAKLGVKSLSGETERCLENIKDKWWPSTLVFYEKKIEALLETEKENEEIESGFVMNGIYLGMAVLMVAIM